MALDIQKEVKSLNARKKAEMALYLNPNMPLSYNGFSEFVFTAVRGIGKTVIALETAIILKRKYGWENVKCYYFRTNENSIKSMLTPEKAVDPFLIAKYDMEISKKKNQVFDHGKLLYEAYPLVSAASIGKGVNLYDCNWFTDYYKTGKKRFIVTIWDEFMLDDGVGRKSVGDPVKQYMIYREAIFRDAQRLPYNAVYNFLLANNVSECANVCGQLFNYIPNPNNHKITKLTRKHAVFWNVPITEKYKEKRANSYNASLIGEDDPNYNDVKRDMSMVKPKSTKIYKITSILAFGKTNDEWFAVYDNKYIKKYTPNMTYSKNLVIPMYRNLDLVYSPEQVAAVLLNSDMRRYQFTDILSMASFQAKMKVFKAK